MLGYLVGKDKLTELHSNWIKYVWYSDRHRSLQAHRGSYKTTAVTEIGSIWWLLFNPNDRIGIVRKPYTESAKTVSTIKQYFATEGIQALFRYAHGFVPKLRQKKENSLIFNFKKSITKEGNIDAYGVDGSLTGNHYDKILCDDFVTLKDRISRAERERTKQGIMEIQTNIIDPGKQCMFVGTPWHKDDSWKIVPDPIKFDVHKTGILTPADIANKQAKTTKVLYACNYLLEHIVSDAAIFADPVYETWVLDCEKVVAHIDAKYEGDCTGALTIMGLRKDGKIQGIGFIFEETVKEKIDWILDKCSKYRVKEIYNETNPDKGYTADEIKKRARERQISLRVFTYAERTNKHIKIVSYLKNYWTQLSWAPETQDEYMVQVTDYAEGQKPDDAPDSAASLLREAFYSASLDMSLYTA